MQMKGSDIARVFFALWPEISVQRELHALAREYQARCNARVMKADTLHMTLLYIGEVNRAHLPQLIQAANKVSVPPFSFALTKLSFWQHNRIGYATSQGEVKILNQLAAALRQELIADGFLFKNHEFTPHVTLLRNVRNVLESQEIRPIMWSADSFVLVESTAENESTIENVKSTTENQVAHYQILQKWRLTSMAVQR